MKRILLIAAAASLILIISGCQAGVTKEQRLEAFISEMESGTAANPREHFEGHPFAYKIDKDTFDSTFMAPDFNLDITGYIISGDTFTMDFTSDFTVGSTVSTASFYSESNNFGGEDWYIKSMTVPTASGVKLIPDDL